MKRINSILLGIIAILLFLLLVLTIFNMITTNQQRQLAEQRAAEYASRVQAVEAIVSSQQDVILSILDDYQTDVYDNPSIDRIAEQQLIAEEYQLAALQVIAIQNGQIIELLAASP